MAAATYPMAKAVQNMYLYVYIRLYMCIYMYTYTHSHLHHNMYINTHICICRYGGGNRPYGEGGAEYTYIQMHIYILICIYICLQ